MSEQNKVAIPERRDEIDYKAFEGHTPGPWFVDTCGIYARCQMTIEGKYTNEQQLFESPGGRGEDLDANLALIAAAPTLLAENVRLRAENAAYGEQVETMLTRMLPAVSAFWPATKAEGSEWPELGALLGWLLEMRDEAVKVLRGLEAHDRNGVCPACWCYQSHMPRCAIATLIAKLEGGAK